MPTVLADRYELQRRIGSGGMATVWLAVDRRLGREVAVKVLSDNLAADDRFRERFEREARRVASLGHPNIVVVHDFGVDGDTAFIVMELVRGVPLRRALLSSPLTPDATRTVALGILAGLGHAHDAGILHRDIKPGNILLTENGSPKLADFGIAKSMEETAALTDSGAILGSVSYASPEQLAGEPLSAASDLYSLSCVLYECLAGRPPFVADNLVTLVARQQGEAPPPLRDFAPSAPRELSDPIMLGLVKDPERRFASTEEMAAAIGRSQDRAPRPRIRTEHPDGLPDGDSLGGPPAGVPSRRRDHPSSSGPKPKGRRRLRPLWIVVALVVLVVGASVAFVIAPRSGPSLSPVSMPHGYVPRLEKTACPKSVTSQLATAQCAWLIVPQSRSQPTTGPMVRIQVTIAPALAGVKPGASPTIDIGATDPLATSPVRARSELIQLQPRGMAPNTPELTCPGVDTVLQRSLAQPSSDPEGDSALVGAYASCHARLVKSGIDPSSYTYDTMADDVVDLMAVLKIRQADLVTYDLFSHVAYGILGKVPGAVRTLTLDNPEPPGVSQFTDPVADLAGAFQRYSSLCQANPSCAANFPNLGTSYQTEQSRFADDPVLAQTDQEASPNIPVLIDGGRAAQALWLALAGNFLPIIAAGIAQPPPGLTADLIYNFAFKNELANDFGVNASVNCSYDLQTFAKGAAVSSTQLPEFAGVAVNQPQFGAICAAWKVPILPASYFGGVASLVPTLIVRGSLNPLGNDGWSGQVKQSLQAATIGIFPTVAGNTTANAPPCLDALRGQFLANPSTHLDIAGCTAKSPPIAFVDTP